MKTIGVLPEDTVGGYVAALGFFDGIHVGHTALLKETVCLAKKYELTPAVLTFHTAHRYKGAPLLLSEEQKEAEILRTGIETLFVYDFEEIASLSPEAFVQKVLKERHSVRFAVVGPNFRFGHGATGTSSLLSEMIPTIVVPFAERHGEIVSSTAIRKRIESGDVSSAKDFLGRPFSITGTVMRGKGLGHTWGFPTINLSLPENGVCPRFGVYIAFVAIEGNSYPAVVNIGVRPSVDMEGVPNLECHILAKAGELYGKSAAVSLLQFLREERRFPSVEALKAQIETDIEEAKAWIKQSIQS